MPSIAAADLSARKTFQILTTSVVPRPIAWTSTVSATGVNNPAPFSFYTVASARPHAAVELSRGQAAPSRTAPRTSKPWVSSSSTRCRCPPLTYCI